MANDTGTEKPVKMVGAVVQAFRVLRLLSTSNVPLGVTAIARDAKVNPSTAFNILRTLVAENAVEFDELSKTYKIGRGLLALSSKLLEESIVDEIRTELNRLATETNCLVGLWKAHDGRMTLLERAVGGRAIRLDMEIKQRLPFMAGAVGRAYAARLKMSDAELRKHFNQLRWEGNLDADTYISEVRYAERTGYAIDREALYPGVVTVATVLTNHEGKVVFGLTASDIAHNLDEAKICALGEEMAGIGRTFSLI